MHKGKDLNHIGFLEASTGRQWHPPILRNGSICGPARAVSAQFWNRSARPTLSVRSDRTYCAPNTACWHSDCSHRREHNQSVCHCWSRETRRPATPRLKPTATFHQPTRTRPDNWTNTTPQHSTNFDCACRCRAVQGRGAQCPETHPTTAAVRLKPRGRAWPGLAWLVHSTIHVSPSKCGLAQCEHGQAAQSHTTTRSSLTTAGSRSAQPLHTLCTPFAQAVQCMDALAACTARRHNQRKYQLARCHSSPFSLSASIAR